jgi:hypothetical protein
MKKMNKSEDYPYIEAWGIMMFSHRYYIDGEKEQARLDGAPQNAIYKDSTRQEWITYDDISNEETRLRIDLIMSS